jgi:molybdate transport system substrate-binding protein
VEVSFGASGVLARQVKEGAPFDVFMSADERFVDEAIQSGACEGGSKAKYARGRLVVWTREGVAPARSLEDLADARFVKVALANPEHAPYGRAAKEALGSAGVWEAVAPKVVRGENVRQAFQFVDSGNAEAGLVSRSLVKAAPPKGSVTEVDEALHAPLDQHLAVCLRGGNAQGGRAFARWVLSDEGQALLERHGLERSSPPKK